MALSCVLMEVGSAELSACQGAWCCLPLLLLVADEVNVWKTLTMHVLTSVNGDRKQRKQYNHVINI